ncbi:MAG: response regulator transcription factor [Rhizobiales bacterium]|nr:response regulator transcription factor [Hyphomicrobiales bacterium]NRB15182.1 response regulator transcription factor [Hyphomicrobiales bacterium]
MNVDKKILIVEDDDLLRDELTEQLSLYNEFELKSCANAYEAIKIADKQYLDLILMDIGLPDMDGREAVKLIRRNGFKGPIIMLTAQSSEADVILGLDSGANDYVLKPFRVGELLARMRAQFRQFEQSEDAVFNLGPYVFKPSIKRLTEADGSEIRLTEKETAILKYLYKADGSSIGRDELLCEVWGYNSGITTHTLETHIYRLRQKIEPKERGLKIIVTDSTGYKINKI